MINISQVVYDITNPDTEAISTKTDIDISYNPAEVSATGYSASVNFNGNDISILNTTSEVTNSNLYYVPIFIEKLNYTTWKNTINKTFEQLSNV